MRVVVTGAFGYLGMALCRHLSRDGHEVVAVGHGQPTAVVPEIHLCDVSNMLRLSADAVVHLVGGGMSGGEQADAIGAYRRNIESVVHVLERVSAPRKILASTIYVYGARRVVFNEYDLPQPDTLYGQQKAVAEAIWRQTGGTALRFAHVYGGSPPPHRDGVTERLARAAAGHGEFRRSGSGMQILDLVHIDDACEAVAAALLASDLKADHAINIGGGRPIMLADLAQIFGVPCGINPQVKPVGRSCALDVFRAQTVLHWQPRVRLEDGAARLIEWAKELP